MSFVSLLWEWRNPFLALPSRENEAVVYRIPAHPDAAHIAADLGRAGLVETPFLFATYLRDDAVIADNRLLRPLYIADLTQQTLQKRALTEQMALRSLYVVPRYEPETHKVICLVNYFTREQYRFSDFEMGLLQTHAELMESVIHEIGGDQMGILIITHHEQLLEHNRPQYTHVILGGRIVETGGPELALELEARGYGWIEAA